MIDGGMATIYVSDMEQSVYFYDHVLGLTLVERFGDDFAIVDAGGGLLLGLRMASDYSPEPGQKGATTLAFYPDRPIEEAREALEARGVEFVGATRGTPESRVRMAFFRDPDGNRFYLYQTPERREALDAI
ncbi:MAG: VOC family protein [Holophagales bacterium]|nr:VOC family protein [Holophagales bacterium]